MGSYRIYLIYGSKDCSVDYKPYGGVAQGGFGLSGGYPTGIGANRVMIEAGLEMLDKIKKESIPRVKRCAPGNGANLFFRRVCRAYPASGRKLLVDYVAAAAAWRFHRPRSPSRLEGLRPRLG